MARPRESVTQVEDQLLDVTVLLQKAVETKTVRPVREALKTALFAIKVNRGVAVDRRHDCIEYAGQDRRVAVAV